HPRSAPHASSARAVPLPLASPGKPPRHFFFFTDTAPTAIYTLSLHDALPISYNGAATPNTTAIVAGDFNHSGHLGLAVVDTSNAATYMLLGNGDGTFAPSSAAFARSPLFDVTLATADLNGDGNLDLTFQNGVV